MGDKERYSNDKNKDLYTHEPFYKDSKVAKMSRFEENILLCFAIFITIIAVIGAIVYAIKVIQYNAYELEESKKINNTYKVIYETKINADKNYITEQMMAERQKVYDKEARERHIKNLHKIETEMAKKEIPPGTYIKIVNTDTQVRVKAWDGFQAICWDGDNYSFNFAYDEWRKSEYIFYKAQCDAQGRVCYTSKLIYQLEQAEIKRKEEEWRNKYGK